MLQNSRLPMTDNSERTGAAIETHYQFLAWLVPAVEKFPKSQKFTLGDRVQTTALDVVGGGIHTKATARMRWRTTGKLTR
jgi:hypothetical protein